MTAADDAYCGIYTCIYLNTPSYSNGNLVIDASSTLDEVRNIVLSDTLDPTDVNNYPVSITCSLDSYPSSSFPGVTNYVDSFNILVHEIAITINDHAAFIDGSPYSYGGQVTITTLGSLNVLVLSYTL